jgi:hypothetical protein
MTREHLDACRHLLGSVPEWVEREADIRSVESRNLAMREVVGVKTMTDTSVARPAIAYSAQGLESAPRRDVDITAPATEAARQWQGWGTALKPALEPITVARKPLIGTVAENVLAHGTGALNVDGCRVEGRERTDYGLTNSTRSAGNTYGKPSVSANFDANQGRWPANLIHDNSEEVVGLFPQTGVSNGRRVAKPLNGFAMKAQPDVDTGYGDSGSAARFFYCAKASKADRDEGNNHPTVKPTALMQYLCRLVTPPGGTVFDPFMGSGSTGKAAMLEGFNFIGIERDPEYVKIAEARIGAAKDRAGLFG